MLFQSLSSSLKNSSPLSGESVNFDSVASSSYDSNVTTQTHKTSKAYYFTRPQINWV